MEEALVACRLVMFTTVMMLFGTVSFGLFALPAGSLPDFDAWARHAVPTCAVAVLVSTVAFLLCQSAAMAGSPAEALDPTALHAVLFETHFGRVWSWQLLISAILALVCSRRLRARQVPVLVLSLLLLTGLARIGHAALQSGLAGTAHQLNQIAHLFAAGLWLGGLVPLGWVLRRAGATRDAAEITLADVAVRRFSQIGYIAVGAIAVTGILNSLVLVGSFEGVLGTPYGRLLAFKVLLFLAMVGVALVNRFRLAPRISEDPAALRELCRNVGLEQVLGLSILAVVSLLGTWPPAITSAGR